MGVCCGASESKPKSRANQNKESHLAKADPNSSMQVDVKDIDSRVKILQRGIEPELEHMINTYDANINSFLYSETLLHANIFFKFSLLNLRQRLSSFLN